MKFKKMTVSTEIPSASMSDIAFLLLIFFLVTTIFNTEQGILLPLPNANTAPKRINRKNLCEIKTDAAGRTTIDGELIQVSTLADVVRRKIFENDKLICVIETHPRAYYGIMVDVLDELKAAEAKKITLRVTKTGGQ